MAYVEHLLTEHTAKARKSQKSYAQKIVELENDVNSLQNKVLSLEEEITVRAKTLEAIEGDYEEKSRQCKRFEV